MTITIVPEPVEDDTTVFRALAGAKQATGPTAGTALDAIAAQLDENESGTLILVQSFRPDRFFSAAQQQRLGSLMAKWREARDRQTALPADEQAELDALVQTELVGVTERAKAFPDEKTK